jgi:hypothetical protein
MFANEFSACVNFNWIKFVAARILTTSQNFYDPMLSLVYLYARNDAILALDDGKKALNENNISWMPIKFYDFDNFFHPFRTHAHTLMRE